MSRRDRYLSVRVPTETIERLHAISRMTGETKSEVVRIAISLGVEAMDQQAGHGDARLRTVFNQWKALLLSLKHAEREKPR